MVACGRVNNRASVCLFFALFVARLENFVLDQQQMLGNFFQLDGKMVKLFLNAGIALLAEFHLRSARFCKSVMLLITIPMNRLSMIIVPSNTKETKNSGARIDVPVVRCTAVD